MTQFFEKCGDSTNALSGAGPGELTRSRPSRVVLKDIRIRDGASRRGGNQWVAAPSVRNMVNEAAQVVISRKARDPRVSVGRCVQSDASETYGKGDSGLW